MDKPKDWEPGDLVSSHDTSTDFPCDHWQVI